jgi:hypothetical protein
MKRGPRVEGKLGGGGGGWERQREITVHEINILVSKGINKDSELGSVPGTQDMTTAWIFATFLALERFYFHTSQVNIPCMIFFMHYLHFNNCSPLRTVFNARHFIIKNFAKKCTYAC